MNNWNLIFAALTAIGAFIRIPIPFVSFTLQFFFCSISGILLGAKKGALSQIIYVVIGLIGLPVFTKGGGPQYILEPTFGYLVGLIFSSYIIGKIAEKNKKDLKNVFLANIAGIIVIYLIGVPYFYFINNFYLGTVMPMNLAIYYGCLITLPGDIIKALITTVVGVNILARINIRIA
ncbi:biotin transporter BioY [Caproiciproducens sp. MSJ-32]|uniref:biotin transporter BioY n=1 Tax=Caproiciproducens sp. MSJ-32 TaxID=2841527 RepID=UPI001C10332C|nr:biotin transporter BioY [Caproiciproducens sp. MSJ-32]MBU5455345.1 biotin transporter BioY [Caproiciproducens sp. MSJ-32]